MLKRWGSRWVACWQPHANVTLSHSVDVSFHSDRWAGRSPLNLKLQSNSAVFLGSFLPAASPEVTEESDFNLCIWDSARFSMKFEVARWLPLQACPGPNLSGVTCPVAVFP